MKLLNSAIRSTAKLGAVTLGVAAAGAAVTAAVWPRRKKFNLHGKVVLITGGSRGLGLALARGFAGEGARLAICARNEAELESARADLKRRSADVLTVVTDVSDPAQAQELVDKVIARYGRIDVLINNAGIIQIGPLATLTLADFETAMETIFWGTVYMTTAALPHLMERDEARIVNITSIGGRVSVPHLLPYSCAKFATVAFSEGLRAELRGTGIKTVTIAPGLMRTGSFVNARFKGDDEREAAWFSVSASLPGLAMSAKRAARKIILATERGTAQKILTLPANLLALLHGNFPGATADLLGLVNQLLPHGQGDASRVIRPHLHQSQVLERLTFLGRQAARRNLQDVGGNASKVDGAPSGAAQFG
ncbi:MAG TPA: SDR family oxidoreductase [Bryobacteraceae bacterium]|jgi:NAD(P)-dependent dehydrogenase (short-subunit alcohol dehydrogenase family)|nr:SDR family oxidoreductase [Bryobacteraceae bacterium]